jgi:predicted acylesterase/phospholipase RssA
MTPNDGHATSLILCNGGSYSAYEIGVMTALFEGKCCSTGYTPFDPDLLIGTSAGALNAGGLIAYEVKNGSLLAAIDELRFIWTEVIGEGPNVCGNGVYRIRGNPFVLFDRGCLKHGLAPIVSNAVDDASLFLRSLVHAAVSFVDSSAPPIRTVASVIDIAALISDAPFLQTIQTFLPLEYFAQSTRRLRVVALDLTAGFISMFDENDVRRFGYLPLHASAAIPLFFPSVLIEDHVYVNGTTLASTPLLPAISESDTMHIVYMDPQLSSISPARLDDVVDAMDRVLVVNFAYMLNQDIERARELNTALALIDEGVTVESLSPMDVHALLRSLARIREGLRVGKRYRPLTIHRYHPRDDLGSDLGLMNLDRKRIIELIDRGYTDTVAHDCVASGCVFPGRYVAPPQAAAAAARPVAPVESPPIRR